MLADVREVAADALVVDAPGGQGSAVAARARGGSSGPVTIVNGDLPCVTRAELEQLTAAAPALVAADDGTTNALALRDAADFEPLYGPGSAARFEQTPRGDAPRPPRPPRRRRHLGRSRACA